VNQIAITWYRGDHAPDALSDLTATLCSQEVLFQEDFHGKLGPGWSWIREHREASRQADHGMEVRIEPGNMWGPQSYGRNVLVTPAPDLTHGEFEIAVTFENRPTSQYEQVDLVWYYDDSYMVKLGQELV
jgi:hypothetical protein